MPLTFSSIDSLSLSNLVNTFMKIGITIRIIIPKARISTGIVIAKIQET